MVKAGVNKPMNFFEPNFPEPPPPPKKKVSIAHFFMCSNKNCWSKPSLFNPPKIKYKILLSTWLGGGGLKPTPWGQFYRLNGGGDLKTEMGEERVHTPETNSLNNLNPFISIILCDIIDLDNLDRWPILYTRPRSEEHVFVQANGVLHILPWYIFIGSTYLYSFSFISSCMQKFI